DSEKLYKNPLHPYTKALLSAVPVPDPDYEKEEVPLQGDMPNPANPPSGCIFHTRCPFKMDVCETTVPPLMALEDGHTVACHLYTKEGDIHDILINIEGEEMMVLKRFKFLACLLMLLVVMALVACSGGDTESTDSAGGDDSGDTSETTDDTESA